MKAARWYGGKAVSEMLRRAGFRAAVAGVVLTALPPCRLTAQETSLTIYSDGRVLVRRTLSVAVPRGVSTFGADLGARDADPTSFLALGEGAQVRGVRFISATGPDGSLRRSLGSDVEFRVGPDSAVRYIRGTLLSVDPPAVRVDGRVLYGYPGTPVFPDSLVQIEPRYELTVEAQRPLNAFRLAFLTGGLAWNASYAVVVPSRGAGSGSVTGAAAIVNGGGLTVRGAQVQLLAGDVRRASPPNRPIPMMMARANAMEAAAVSVGPAEESVGETHVYTLPGVLDIARGETRTIALFARTETPVEPEFVLRPQGYGPIVRWPDVQREVHPEVSYLVRRPSASAFGAQPLPAGTVRVFAPDSAGRLQLVGEAGIGHTPAGRELHLATGTVFDVTAERTQTAYDNSGRRQVVASYRVVLRNAKDTAVTVQVLDQFPGTWELLSSTAEPERLSSSSVRFPVVVPATGEATLEYRVRIRW